MYSHKIESPASAVHCSFFPSFWHHFTPFFCRKTLPKFKTLRGNQGEGEQWAASCSTSPLSQATTVQLPSQLRPAANLSISPSAQTKPVQLETGLPAPTRPRNAALDRSVSRKAEGPWDQSPSLGTDQLTTGTGVCKAGRGVRVRSGGPCWLLEGCTLAPRPNDKGWLRAEKPLPSPPPASAKVGR